MRGVRAPSTGSAEPICTRHAFAASRASCSCALSVSISPDDPLSSDARHDSASVRASLRADVRRALST